METELPALDITALLAARIPGSSTETVVTTHDGVTVTVAWNREWHRPHDGNSWHIENGTCAWLTPRFGMANPLTDDAVPVGRQWPYAWMADWTLGREYPTVINGIDGDELEGAIGLLVDTARAQRAHAAVRQQRMDRTVTLLMEACDALAAARAHMAEDGSDGPRLQAEMRAAAHLDLLVGQAIRDGLLSHQAIAVAAGTDVSAVERRTWDLEGPVPPQYYLSEAGFARATGLAKGTISKYKSEGRLPPPDIQLGGSDGWLLLTVERFKANRRGQGSRTDLKATIS